MLDGIAVLITRPRDQSAELAAMIESRGGTAIVFPSLEIVPRDPASIDADLAALNPADISIFISQNAVDHGLAFAEGLVAAIGPTTAAAIERAGKTVAIRPVAGFDSEHLLAEPAFDDVTGKTIRIIRGGPGRERLADDLRSRGARVEYLSAYERRLPDYSERELGELEDRWRRDGIDAVVIMSVQSLVNLEKLLPDWCRRQLAITPLVTPSGRVLKESLKRFPGCRAILAAGPGAGVIADSLAVIKRFRPMVTVNPDGPINRTDQKTGQKMSDTEKDETPSGNEDADAKPAGALPDETADDAAPDASGAAGSGGDGDTGPDRSDEVEPEPSPAPVVVRKRGASATVAWLALFLALITVAGVGYLGLEKYRADRNAAQDAGAIAALSDELDETERALAELRGSLDALASNESETGRVLESLRRDLDDRAQLFDSLPPRMTSLERTIAALQGVSLDARNTYLVAEAEYYLQIANAQLQLAGNSYLATLALEQADDRLLQLGDPALTDVRRAIADEIAALEVIERPDIAGLTLTLASLARVVDSLPLRRMSEAEVVEEDADAQSQSGAARAWASVKGAASRLVSHTPPGEVDAPLLTPDAEPLIRSNLALQLQAARLAMLRGEVKVFEQSLDDADAWINEYFDTRSEPVAGARRTIDEIRNAYSVSSPPDISGSLRLLRQYKALVEPGE